MISGYDETNGTLEEILASAAAREVRLGRELAAKQAGEVRSLAEEEYLPRQQKLEEILLSYPVFEYAFGNTQDIPFSEKVLEICVHDCIRYGRSWACPPHAGCVEDNIKRVRSYRHFLLFSTLNEVADPMIDEQCLQAKRPHEELTRQLRTQLQQEWKSRFYVLSSGCMLCERCACPDEECRHPQERLMTTESHGIVLLQLVEQLGLSVFSGQNEIPYYSMILFD